MMRKIHKVKDDKRVLCGKRRGFHLLMTTSKNSDVTCITCEKGMNKK